MSDSTYRGSIWKLEGNAGTVPPDVEPTGRFTWIGWGQSTAYQRLRHESGQLFLVDATFIANRQDRIDELPPDWDRIGFRPDAA